jgi:subtilisin family serine protease
MSLSGTSMADAIVAGAAALIVQANPSLTPNMVKRFSLHGAAASWLQHTRAGCRRSEHRRSCPPGSTGENDLWQYETCGRGLLNTTVPPTPKP